MPQPQTQWNPLCSPLAGDPALRELVEMFVEEMPQRIARLRQSFDAHDWHALRLGLRHLSGAASSHGFDQLVPPAADVETRLTRRAPTPEVGQALECLLTQCGRVTASPQQPSTHLG
jgi:HPt (histidine-containing phosphotransfer) domain-containing protein